MTRWTQMPRHSPNKEKIELCNSQGKLSLQLIDQFFRQGFLEKDLAVRFSISQTSLKQDVDSMGHRDVAQ